MQNIFENDVNENTFAWFHMGETQSGQKIVVLHALYLKQKNIYDYRLQYENVVFIIKNSGNRNKCFQK